MGIGLLELLVLLLLPTLLVVAVAAVVVVTRGRRVPGTRESRLVALTRWGGLLAGLVVASRVVQSGAYFSGAMLAPAAAGLGLLVGVAAGETLVRPRRPAGPRAASLRPRRVRDYAPRHLGPAVAVQTLLLVALLALTTLTASTDPYTDTVRALTCTGPGVSSSRTPYPGSFYSGPLALALLAVLAVAALAARQVVHRPRGRGPAEDDDALRRRSLGVVVAATGIAVAASYGGIALSAGIALHGLGGATPGCAPAWMQPVGLVIGWSVLPSLVLLLACVVSLVGDRARLPVAAYPPGPPAPVDAP
ncbi:hypothetical protein ASG49_14495 [Marmoricola sp. Leaf446]|uniref:hypothetical protein n=1 Tax=Marmoricola sp. Leaf446 TaxID=1736379 RepID=UPI0006F6BF4E|nr:hypothetical protein [Marmoricola sp. Leaf446]KQT90919.1 hypothetical protein ASG49_14495 [Marmoricola sp. Leaf446]